MNEYCVRMQWFVRVASYDGAGPLAGGHQSIFPSGTERSVFLFWECQTWYGCFVGGAA